MIRLLVVGLLSAMTPLSGQQPSTAPAPLGAIRTLDATPGSAIENTLLTLRLVSSCLETAELIRPIVAWTRDSLTATGCAQQPVHSGTEWTVEVSRPWLAAWLNTSAARLDRDGPVWQGRGVTVALSGGAVMNRGFVSMAFRPIAFWSENAAYDPAWPIAPAPGSFRDVVPQDNIDLPYRFGSSAFAKLYAGESWVRADARHVGAGFSTSSQIWGPSHYYPLVMGVEAGGFPRLFVEGRSLPIGLGTVDVNWLVGRLEASPYSELPAGDRSRLAPAAAFAFAPSGFNGLTIGGARFFHIRWQPSELNLRTMTLPWAGLLNAGNSTGEGSSRDLNQLASAFARVAPGAGVEVYAELYREDHNADLRDLVGEPDHESAYTLGLRRAWKADNIVQSLTVETLNGRISHLARVRSEGSMYVHGAVAEGHTYEGQALGSSAAIGGGGSVVAFDRLSKVGALQLRWEHVRTAQRNEGGTWNGDLYGYHALEFTRSQSAKSQRSLTTGVQIGYGPRRSTNLYVRLVTRR